MEYLKVEDLKSGYFYYCRLSQKEVLYNVITRDMMNTPTSWGIKFYNETTGYFCSDSVDDYQLRLIQQIK